MQEQSKDIRTIQALDLSKRIIETQIILLWNNNDNNTFTNINFENVSAKEIEKELKNLLSSKVWRAKAFFNTKFKNNTKLKKLILS